MAIRAIGWSVGLVHRDAFVYGMTSRAGRTLLPSAILVHAPFATLLAEKYPGLEAGALAKPTFANLGIRWLPKKVVGGEPADHETDAQTFSIFALDMLARHNIKIPKRSHLIGALRAIVERDPDQFDSPELMLEIIDCIEDPDMLWEILERLADEA
jgi:hypothetical protein